MPDQKTVPAAPVSAPAPTAPPIAPTNQIGATSNPQTSPTGFGSTGSPVRLPGEAESNFQTRAISHKDAATAASGNRPGDYIYDPRLDKNATIKKFDPATSLSYTVGGANDPSKASGIMKMPESSGFKKPDTSSFQSGTSLTNAIPNIMADSGVQSSIGNVTQPVTTGLMRGVPKMPTPAYQPQYQNVDLYNETTEQDFI